MVSEVPLLLLLEHHVWPMRGGYSFSSRDLTPKFTIHRPQVAGSRVVGRLFSKPSSGRGFCDDSVTRPGVQMPSALHHSRRQDAEGLTQPLSPQFNTHTHAHTQRDSVPKLNFRATGDYLVTFFCKFSCQISETDHCCSRTFSLSRPAYITSRKTSPTARETSRIHTVHTSTV